MTNPRWRLHGWRRKRMVHKLINRYGMTCAYCCAPLNRTPGHARQLTVDHRVPRSENGSSRFKNLCLACATCNRRKAAMSWQEYVATPKLIGRRAQIAAELARTRG